MIKDYTWEKLIVVDLFANVTTFYRHMEHGGPMTSIFAADTASNPYDAIKMLDVARHNYPTYNLVIKRFNYTLDDIPMDILVEHSKQELRIKALNKLTAEEKEALGI